MPNPPGYQRFFAELKRRKVFRVAAGYGAVAFVVIQVADVMFPRIPLPDWTISFVVWLCILGFPVAVVMAWVFERTSEGLRRTEQAAESEIDEIVAQPAARRWPSGLAALAGTALLVAGVWAAWQVAAPTSVEVAEARLAVFPFGVSSSSTDLEWLNEGLPTILSQNLFEPGETETVDPVRVINSTDRGQGQSLDVAAAGAVARRLGAGRFVVGSVQGAGGRVRINAGLYALRDSIHSITRGEVEGDTTELFGLVDRLTAQLLGGTEEFGAANRELVRTAAHTTDSLPALKAYLEGEKHLRDGELDEARESFLLAVESDTTFALAMYRNAFTHALDYGYEEATELAERAGRHAYHLSEYDRQALEAFSKNLAGEIRQAEREYRELIRAYPSRLDARVLLALLLADYEPMRGRSLDAAAELFAELREADPGYLCLECLGQSIFLRSRDYVALTEHWLEMARLEPDSTEAAREIPRAEAFLALATGDSAGWATARRDVLPTLESGQYGFFWVALGTGRPALADTLLREDFADLGLGRERRWMDFARGRWSQAYEQIAEEEQPESIPGLYWRRVVYTPLDARIPGIDAYVEQALALDSTTATGAHAELYEHGQLFTAALLSLQAGNTEAALQLADSIATLPVDSTFAPVTRNAVRTIRGETALRTDDIATARTELDALEWEVSPVGRHMLTDHFGIERAHFLRAEAAWRDGDVEAAQRWFDQSLTNNSDYSLIELRRGQIQEALGNLEQARLHYARVVEALEPAEEELIPRRDEARSRLAALLEAGS